LIPRYTSNLSAYIQNLPTHIQNLPTRVSSLSAYVKTPRFAKHRKASLFAKHRTKASAAVAVAAVAAGIGAAAASTSSSATGHAAAASPAASNNGHLFGSMVAADAVAAVAHHPAGTVANRPAASKPDAAQPATPVKMAVAAANHGSAPAAHALQPFPDPLSGAQHQAGAQLAQGPAKPKAAAHNAAPAQPAAPSKPYSIYDSVNPSAIPSGQQQVAVYANGSYQASWSDAHGRSNVLWIDTRGNNPGSNVLDVEPGDATPTGAAQWVQARESQYPNHTAIVYTMRSEWSAVKNAISALPGPMQANVRYWIADPTGSKHMVAGADATQWYWGPNYDITAATPRFTS
jgi:hypothetical protein